MRAGLVKVMLSASRKTERTVSPVGTAYHRVVVSSVGDRPVEGAKDAMLGASASGNLRANLAELRQANVMHRVPCNR